MSSRVTRPSKRASSAAEGAALGEDDLKSFVVHSAVFELYAQEPGEGRADDVLQVLQRLRIFYAFDIVELVNAKLCMEDYLARAGAVPKNFIEVFWVCCIISRKFWNDEVQKNSEELDAAGARGGRLDLEEVNRLEREILVELDYAIAKEEAPILREIENERNVDKMYRRVLRAHAGNARAKRWKKGR